MIRFYTRFPKLGAVKPAVSMFLFPVGHRQW